jgi:hypothetical protein
VARQPGYVLDLGDDGTDVRVAERLVRHGARSADPVRGARLLDALWTRATVALAETRLAAGDHAALVPDLEQTVADHPLDEQLHALLMLARYARCCPGRPAA